MRPTAPAPGWYDDPWAAGWVRWWDGAQWTPHTSVRPMYGEYLKQPMQLDGAVAAMKANDPQPWGWRPVGIPIIAYIVLIVTGQIVSRNWAPTHGNGLRVFIVVANVILEAALGAAVYFAGRDVARRNGGWGAAFGLRWPRWSDAVPALAGFGAAFGLRIVIGITAGLLTNGKAITESQNLKTSGSVSTFAIVVLVITAVIAAPIVEETVFRGLLLRTFLRRMSFWPAALLSTAIFGLGHTYEVGTVAGAVTLALIVGSMGFVNCIVNRYTNRLTAGMFVHALFNGLAILFLALGAA
jgi:membrane protease YdiL (CAAX protease family)